jgi:hypothetical protein
MQVLIEQKNLRFPEGTKTILNRAAEELRMKPSDYIRSAVLDRLRDDGFLTVGRRLNASMKAVADAKP